MSFTQIRALLDERNSLIAQSRAIDTEVESRGGSHSAEEIKRQDKLDEQIAHYDERVQRSIAIEESEQRSRDAASRYGTIPKSDGNPGAPGFRNSLDAPTGHAGAFMSPAADFVRTINSGQARASVDIPIETRDTTLLSTFTQGSGEGTVPERVHPEIWKHLVHESPILMLAQTFPTADGAPLQLSASESFSAPGIIEEGQQIPVDNPNFKQIEFDAYKIAALGSITNELEQDNAVAVARRAEQCVRLAEDRRRAPKVITFGVFELADFGERGVSKHP